MHSPLPLVKFYTDKTNHHFRSSRFEWTRQFMQSSDHHFRWYRLAPFITAAAAVGAGDSPLQRRQAGSGDKAGSCFTTWLACSGLAWSTRLLPANSPACYPTCCLPPYLSSPPPAKFSNGRFVWSRGGAVVWQTKSYTGKTVRHIDL